MSKTIQISNENVSTDISSTCTKKLEEQNLDDFLQNWDDSDNEDVSDQEDSTENEKLKSKSEASVSSKKDNSGATDQKKYISTYCKDKPKYGGLGTKKQKCIERKCKFS